MQRRGHATREGMWVSEREVDIGSVAIQGGCNLRAWAVGVKGQSKQL